MPIRRLDFTNLPIETPPQHSHGTMKLEFPSTAMRDDGFERRGYGEERPKTSAEISKPVIE